jgi:ABC-type glycerol-3-phosphate transport system substrate-binding protein
MKSRLFFIFLIILFVLPMTFLWGGGKEGEGVEEEEIVLSLFTQAPGAYPEIFPEIIKSFEAKHPGVKVDMRVVGYGEYQSSLATMIAA